jgi:hypothetical protein
MIARLLCALALTLLALAPVGADALTERLKVWDDGPQDPSFVKFRDGLKDILARKDAKALMKIVAPNIKNSFDNAEDGAAKFRKGWKPEDPKSAIWPALSLVVNMGGNFDSKTAFSAPYVSSAFPSDLDVFEHLVVTTEGAVMRSAPKADAPIVRKLDHDILTVVKTASKPQHEAGPNDWSEVKDANGVQGFVLDRDVRSPIDYRAYFEKKKGRWLMTSFLAGD